MSLRQELSLHPGSALTVRRLLAALELGGDSAHDVNLVATELVTNCVQHGGQGQMRFSARHAEGIVRLEVNCPRGTTEPRIASRSASGGLGLVIVSKLSRDWGVRTDPDRTVVWAEIAVE